MNAHLLAILAFTKIYFRDVKFSKLTVVTIRANKLAKYLK